MRRLLPCLPLLCLLLAPRVEAATLHVQLAHPDDPLEQAVGKRLRRLEARYPLAPWLVQTQVMVDRETWPPHSHPVLTIPGDRRLLDNPTELLSYLLHEQIHWLLAQHSQWSAGERAARTAALFPGAVAERPQGSGDLAGTYNHVLVCYLEYRALADMVGAEQALTEMLGKDHYTWVYALVTDPGNREVLDRLTADALGPANPLRAAADPH